MQKYNPLVLPCSPNRHEIKEELPVYMSTPEQSSAPSPQPQSHSTMISGHGLTGLTSKSDSNKRKISGMGCSASEHETLSKNPRSESQNGMDKTDDYYQAFGNYVAAELRNMRSDDNRNKLTRIIQRAILDMCEVDDLIDTNSYALPHGYAVANRNGNIYLSEDSRTPQMDDSPEIYELDE